MSDGSHYIRLFCVPQRVVEIRVLFVVIKPGSFAIGRSEIRQKVGFIQVFDNKLTVGVYRVVVGHDSLDRSTNCLVEATV